MSSLCLERGLQEGELSLHHSVSELWPGEREGAEEATEAGGGEGHGELTEFAEL